MQGGLDWPSIINALEQVNYAGSYTFEVIRPRHDETAEELAKLTFILALSHYLMYRQNYRRLPGLITPFLLTLVPLVLVLREPDLRTALLFLPVLAFVSTGSVRRRANWICSLGSEQASNEILGLRI